MTRKVTFPWERESHLESLVPEGRKSLLSHCWDHVNPLGVRGVLRSEPPKRGRKIGAARKLSRSVEKYFWHFLAIYARHFLAIYALREKCREVSNNIFGIFWFFFFYVAPFCWPLLQSADKGPGESQSCGLLWRCFCAFRGVQPLRRGAHTTAGWNGIGAETSHIETVFDFSDVMYCLALHQINSVWFQCCNGLHHVFTALDPQGQNCCIKSIPVKCFDVIGLTLEYCGKRPPKQWELWEGKPLKPYHFNRTLGTQKACSKYCQVLPSNESYESKTGCNRTLATVLWVPLSNVVHHVASIKFPANFMMYVMFFAPMVCGLMWCEWFLHFLGSAMINENVANWRVNKRPGEEIIGGAGETWFFRGGLVGLFLNFAWASY